MLDVEGLLRKLAKTERWQTIFAFSRDSKINFFKNQYKYTSLQILFLNYLSLYYVLNMDISAGDVDKMVLDNTTYEDAYFWYKSKKDKKDTTPKKPEKKVQAVDDVNKTQWVFKNPIKE